MQAINEKDYKLFQSLAGLTQEGLKKTMTSFLKDRYDKVCSRKEYIYAVGDIPVAVVAHMDTVFKTPPTNIYYDEKKTIMWSPEGLGADDRAGVFAVIKIIQSGLRPTVIFTTDEEIGALGADALVKDLPEPYTDLSYVIQLDRRGSNDCVFYDCDNQDFVKYVESFGFAENFGSFSDISVICPAWKIAGVNLSVGYQNEHNYIETLNTTHLIQTITKVKKMLSVSEFPHFIYVPSKYSWNSKLMLSPGYDEKWWQEETCTCSGCGKKFSEYEVLPAISKDEPHDTIYFCPDCCVEHIDWCIECNNGYEIDKDNPAPDNHLCPKCNMKKIKPKGSNR